MAENATLYNHIVLPPQLPQRQDENLRDAETLLVDRLLQVSRCMRDLDPPAHKPTPAGHPARAELWETVRLSLQTCRLVNVGGRVERVQLKKAFRDMKDDFLVLYIACQNAGLFIYFPSDPGLKGSVVFEAFEASPRNKDVQMTHNALRWEFPGVAVAIPLAIFRDEDFLSGLATFLEHASVEAPKLFAAHAFKAGKQVYEYRDSTDPSLITSLLMAILEENGRRIAPMRLQKRVRDDVCWNNGREPWRRMPYWLVLRVGLQRFLSIQLGAEIGRAEYKFALCRLLTTLVTPLEQYDTRLDRLDLLKRKLCRRLVKLDVDKSRMQNATAVEHYELLFAGLTDHMDKSLQMASDYIGRVWASFRRGAEKILPSLPTKADAQDLRMSLRSSRPQLQRIMTWYKDFKPASRYDAGRGYSKDPRHSTDAFAQSCRNIQTKEAAMRAFCGIDTTDHKNVCSLSAEHIQDYLAQAQTLYQNNPEQKSIMLLTAMEIWVKMDRATCALYPLLKHYYPVFHPGMLDCLLLPSLSDMQRLARIQRYLQTRISRSDEHRISIFSDPGKGCFAQRYYDESDDRDRFVAVHKHIMELATDAKQEKRVEWERKTAEYVELKRRIDAGTCMFVVDETDPRATAQHDPRCPRCRLIKRAEAKRIAIFEDPLPSDATMAKAVIFEILCPKPFAKYRDTTWFLINTLGVPDRQPGTRPKVTIQEYAPLRSFSTAGPLSLSLSSTTKSFAETHYSTVYFPIEWEDGRLDCCVCLPNGLKLGYYDQQSEVWPGRERTRPSFFHHLKLPLPSSSPFASVLDQCKYIAAGSATGQSSYEVMASQPKCPPGLNMHEYLAFQTICIGSSQRWITLLVELASANLNFSNEATTSLVAYLSSQCGAPHEHGDPYRQVHAIFRDSSFTGSLAKQLSTRLDTLAANWREVFLMQLVVTLALRLLYLADTEERTAQGAIRIIERAREICLRWVRMLREETFQSQDEQSAQRFQSYALWAALLCRRTFEVFTQDGHGGIGDELATYLECSIAVNENLTGKVGSLPLVLQHAIMRDMKMASSLSTTVQLSLQRRPHVFRMALAQVWPEAGDGCREIGPIATTIEGWVNCQVLASDKCAEQRVGFNHLRGILLIDGQPIGKLPKDSDYSAVLAELFGDRPLLTRPTTYLGMNFLLCLQPHNFRVFVGYDTEGVVVLAVRQVQGCDQRLRFIPAQVFRGDLPGHLIENHVHWLDLHRGVVYVTPKGRQWVPFSPYNWVLQFRGVPRCTRRGGVRDGGATLVDPTSPLFGRIAKALGAFESPWYMYVSQPGKGNLDVHLPRHQQKLFVNQNGLLGFPQLKSEIDPNQDAGTWYGFQNKLVLRDYRDKTKRSILVPMGKIEAHRQGCHVLSRVAFESGGFGKFTINNTLGRIDCAPEPWLLYTKALLHALTSSVVPDSLTGRTGTEEALLWLQSGACQPWLPLRRPHLVLLTHIATLAPRKEYYPEALQDMRMDHWDDELTCTVQHEALYPAVTSVIDSAKKLEPFFPADLSPGDAPEFPPASHEQLQRRSLVRRRLYERPLLNGGIKVVPLPEGGGDRTYLARDRPTSKLQRHRNVLESVRTIRHWPERIRTTKDLARLLSHGDKNISGYRGIFDKASLADRLNVDMRENWGPLVNLFRTCTDKYTIMFNLAPMVFDRDADMSLAHVMVAFAVFPELRQADVPAWIEYERFAPKKSPSATTLLPMITPYQRPRPMTESDQLGGLMSSKQMKKVKREDTAWREAVDKHSELLVQILLSQWPCEVPSAAVMDDNEFVDVPSAMKAIYPEWRRLFQNRDLYLHLVGVQSVLDQRWADESFEPTLFIDTEEHFPVRVGGHEMPCLDELMKKAFSTPATQPRAVVPNGPRQHEFACTRSVPPSGPRYATTTTYQLQNLPSAIPTSLGELDWIVKTLNASHSRVRQRYGNDLSLSIDAYRGKLANRTPPPMLVPAAQEDKQPADAQFSRIVQSLCRKDHNYSAESISWMVRGGLWPIVTRCSILSYMGTKEAWNIPSESIRNALIQYGLLLTTFQRSKRLNDYATANDGVKYNEERSHRGHSNWKPSEHPDWLLLEIEANILIRADQVDVALATIRPASGANSVLQMNMGQGKTSVIIPMVSSTLADGKSIVRIVVPKSLLRQTAQILQMRLGGVLNRRLLHIPFARRTSTDHATMQSYLDLHKRLQKDGGVMVCLPEHNLSFMLSGLQRLLDGQVSQAGPMIRLHRWLGSVCRDVLDESDYTLAVRTQLIYPSGSQMTVDGHPYRWKIAETLLHLVDINLHGLSNDFPHSLDVVRRHGLGFPFMFFLRQDVEEELLRRITADVLKKNSPILPMESLSLADRHAVRDFVSNVHVSKISIAKVRKLFPDQPSVRQIVYLVRGLLVNRILLMTLKKRWNVQYGLHPDRDPIAVPFHAKGVPSEQSEWGHPDVAILFTCLSFYYGGLNIPQLKQSLEQVLKSDDPATEYEKWIQGCENFPESMKSWNSINVDDELQLAQMWQVLRYKVEVVNYFLNTFVFPLHAKQFKVKLQSNGWDLPLLSSLHSTDENPKGRERLPRALSTGFSGTNDNRNMLPLNIKQEDLPGLSHTNAEVMTYILDSRSRECVHAVNQAGQRASEEELLRLLMNRGIRVLIDAGAQILEMDNKTLAREWLKIDGKAQGALYFDDDRPMVITKTGNSTPFLASPFADDLTLCLVYLDEAHTRGTDLKLPTQAKGALTLGLGQTKDHTVQAAMRLRQLATTQSIAFFIPPEVHQSIADLRKKSISDKVDSFDVLCWLVNNTCDGLEQLQPLYYSQGQDFCKRMQAALENADFLDDEEQRENYIAAVKQDEMQTLQKLYEPRNIAKTVTLSGTHEKLRGFVRELRDRRANFQDTGRAVHGSALQEVEQEREVAFEVETVRQVKRPFQYSPLTFPGLHRDLESFVRTGRLPAASDGMTQVFVSLSKTAVGRKFNIYKRHSQSKLFVSLQFDRTVKLNDDLGGDNFLRPVNWILWSTLFEIAIVIVPEEAEIIISLLRDIQAAGHTTSTHLLTYSAPVTRKMLHFNDMDFLAIPALPDWKAPMWLRVELGIFAGRLYFDWSEYSHICSFLGLDETSILEDEAESSDPSSSSGPTTTDRPKKTFTTRPLTFLQEWLAIRRRGQDFIHTPMGFITQGKVLHGDHAFFKQYQVEAPEERILQIRKRLENEGTDVDDYLPDEDFDGELDLSEESWEPGSPAESEKEL